MSAATPGEVQTLAALAEQLRQLDRQYGTIQQRRSALLTEEERVVAERAATRTMIASMVAGGRPRPYDEADGSSASTTEDTHGEGNRTSAGEAGGG